jgi:hypothetical protein
MVSALITIFALTAIVGVTLAALHFGAKKLPMWLALLHGVLAVTGLVVLIASIMKLTTAGVLSIALVLFIAAALGGLALFFGFYLRRKALSSPIVVLHALLAVAGFALVLIAAVSP